jgi:hypothetical protein
VSALGLQTSLHEERALLHLHEIQDQVRADIRHGEDIALLGTLAKDRAAARQALDDVTSQIRALACRLVTDEVLSEADAARRAGVDRMTIRQWLGKR